MSDVKDSTDDENKITTTNRNVRLKYTNDVIAYGLTATLIAVVILDTLTKYNAPDSFINLFQIATLVSIVWVFGASAIDKIISNKK